MKVEVSDKANNLFVALLLLLCAAGAGVSQAVADSGDLTLFAVSQNTDAQVQHSSGLFESIKLSDTALTQIGRELSKPPIESNNSIKSSQFVTKQLPAIPATFFMALTGFLCVSLVKDRKIWLSAAFGLLYLGTAGINVVPRLMSNPENIKINKSTPKAVSCGLKDYARPNSDAQSVRYIGLIHRMTAVPADDSFAQNQGKISIKAHCLDVLIPHSLRLSSTENSLYSYISAIINSYNSKFSLTYLFTRAQNWVCSSQVFKSFNNLAHGPPIFA